MTDNKIIKALECCAIWGECIDCPYDDIEYKSPTDNCTYNSTKDAIDLINRQQAENTELQRKNIELQYEKVKLKNEAIKEFAERLKLRFRNTVSCNYGAIHEAVNRIVKEMTEDEGK
jgi:uncharacterized protein (DUF2225 family)